MTEVVCHVQEHDHDDSHRRTFKVGNSIHELTVDMPITRRGDRVNETSILSSSSKTHEEKSSL